MIIVVIVSHICAKLGGHQKQGHGFVNPLAGKPSTDINSTE